MAEKISRIMFHILTLILLYCTYLLFCEKKYITSVCVFCLTIIINPFVTDKISKKLGDTKSDYWYAVRMMLIFCGILVALIIAMPLYKYTNLSSNDGELKEFRSIIKISVYIVYIIVLFLWKNSDKYLKYLIFGSFYLLCIILSFCTDTLHGYIMETLNRLPDGNLDTMSYNILIDDCLVPIKEAILTYIIFDTVFGIKKKNKVEDEGNVCKKADIVKKASYMPYDFNTKYQYLTYKNIGIKHRVNYMAEKYFLYRFRRCIRNLRNNNDKKYKNFDSFLEWKEYVIENKRQADYLNNKNFIHFLKGRLRTYDFKRNLIGNLVIPLYTVIASGLLAFILFLVQDVKITFLMLDIWIWFSIFLLFILIYLERLSKKTWNLYYFYKDYIEIVEGQEEMCVDTNHQ